MIVPAFLALLQDDVASIRREAAAAAGAVLIWAIPAWRPAPPPAVKEHRLRTYFFPLETECPGAPVSAP